MGKLFHRILYRLLSLENYLRVVSRMFFLYRALGLGRKGRALEYVYHLPQLVAKGDTAIDIGANLGYYARPIADIVGHEGHLYAVEPVPVIFSVLQRNMRGYDNATLLNYALGEEERAIEMANDSVAAAGYFEFFDEKRIQIIGKAEESFLANFIPEKAKKRVEDLFSHKPRRTS